MKKYILTIILILSAVCMTANNSMWKAYMAYHDVTEIEKAGDMIYVLASVNLYSYNTSDSELRTFDKSNILSDCGISHIAWCQQAKRLVIVYQNQNIDLMEEKGTAEVINVSDYYRKSMTEDKTIHSIYVNGQYAYLATGFGIVKLNVQKAEIDDTYNLQLNVSHCYIHDNFIYAADREKGTYRASMNSNLMDKANWSKVGDYTEKNSQIDPELLDIVKNLNPGGPKYNNFGFMRFHKGKLYTVGAGYSVVQDLNRPGCIQVFDGNEWQLYEDDISGKIGGNYFYDVNALDINPNDENHVFASGKTGIFEFKNGSFVKHYSYDNSALVSSFTNDKHYVVVQGLKFDEEGNLWCVNSINNYKNILKLSKDYEWDDYFKEELKALSNISCLTFDSRKLLWMVNNSWQVPSLYCYQPQTDAMNSYTTFINQDGTNIETDYVRCVAEDKRGNIWVGTAVGPLVLTPDEITNNPPVFEQVKVPRNDGTNNADYLLAGVDITCMAIDGAGRKWFGTNGNGVYLISEDNMTQTNHFTANNSQLLSDYIESIAIDDRTGEVYIGTNKGLCSYKGGATAPVEEMNKDVTYAYPNPVRPDYTGPITITGLTYNADVKIVTANGTLVAQGKSNGGNFEWDGRDTRGKRVASGVYMVQTATADGSKGTVCKIAVIN